jgi:predicted DNA-binding transcriptional regulator YafY
VRQITLTGFAFRADRQFDIRRYLNRSWLASAFERWFAEDERSVTRIRVTAELMDMLKRDWLYQKARFTPEPDGRVVMSLPEIDPRAILPLVRWLGPDAEILSPRALREAFIKEVKRLAEIYG